jgi:hypothetical protein
VTRREPLRLLTPTATRPSSGEPPEAHVPALGEPFRWALDDGLNDTTRERVINAIAWLGD